MLECKVLSDQEWIERTLRIAVEMSGRKRSKPRIRAMAMDRTWWRSLNPPSNTPCAD